MQPPPVPNAQQTEADNELHANSAPRVCQLEERVCGWPGVSAYTQLSAAYNVTPIDVPPIAIPDPTDLSSVYGTALHKAV